MLDTQLPTAPDGQPFSIITLKNAQGTQLQVMDWGATWLSCCLLMADNSTREVLLGCKNPQDYLHQQAYLGATVGRYANRINHSRIKRNDSIIELTPNQEQHQLHGGPNSVDKRRWDIVTQTEQIVTFRLESADGDNGYPGNLRVEVTYSLTDKNRVEISYRAEVDRSCPINMTNHAYFNLDGINHDSRNHRLQINGDKFLPVDSQGIPNGNLTSVEGLSMDFRQPKTLSQDFMNDEFQRQVSGYDHAYLLSSECKHAEKPAALVYSSDNQIRMLVYTTKPALQLYSGNFLAGTPSRDGGVYANYAGLALESEFLPDSPNHPEWPQPDCWISPGQVYRSLTVYQFELI